MRSGAMHDVDVVVVGGGWSGLAAAIELQQSGLSTLLLEAAPQLGGRARRISLDLGFGPVNLDNGQHLLIGAYRETLSLMRRIGIEPDSVLKRRPMQLVRTDGLTLCTPALPAPLHLLVGLLRAEGFERGERRAIVKMMVSLRLARWTVDPAETVYELLTRLNQPSGLITRLWAPFCVAALNTPAERASAKVFASVLRDSLGADATACDFLLPRTDLSACLPDPAERWLRQAGAQIVTGCAVRALKPQGEGWRLATDRGDIQAPTLVLATPLRGSLRLLAPSFSGHPVVEALAQERFEDIQTVYVAWPESMAPKLPDWIMLDDREEDSPGQWLFDRGQQEGHRLAAVVISAAPRERSPRQLYEQVAGQISRQLQVSTPTHLRVVTERHASFQAACGRPLSQWPGGAAHSALSDHRVWLAGDYLEPDYPATLEAAVRGGLKAARALSTALRTQ